MSLTVQDIRNAVDSFGFCLVFDSTSREWKRLASIDCREQAEKLALTDVDGGTESPVELVKLMCWTEFVTESGGPPEGRHWQRDKHIVPRGPVNNTSRPLHGKGATQLQHLARRGHK